MSKTPSSVFVETPSNKRTGVYRKSEMNKTIRYKSIC